MLAVALVYLGWKFGAVYWQAHKVDTAMDAIKYEAAELTPTDDYERAERLLERVTRAVTALGIDDPNLAVFFAENYTSVHVNYKVEMRFWFGYERTMKFERSLEIPRDEL